MAVDTTSDITEILVRVDRPVYEQLADDIRRYESALLRWFRKRGGFRPGDVGPGEVASDSGKNADIAADLARVEHIRCVALAHASDRLELSAELRNEMNQLLKQVRAAEPASYELIRVLYASVGLGPSEVQVLADRLHPWATPATEPVIDFYRRTAAADAGVVAIVTTASPVGTRTYPTHGPGSAMERYGARYGHRGGATDA